MGLNHSPKIVTDGLVFAYDMGNTNKSWKGAPTTNRVPNATAFSGWTNYYRTLARTSFTTEFGTTGWRFTNQPSWSGILIGYSVPSTGTYTFSAYYKYLNSSASNNGGSVYVSGWGGNDVAASVNKNLVGVWQRVQITLTLTNLSGTFYLISFGGTDSGTTSPDYTSFEVTMPMIESGSFATPFVDGTRSTTNNLVDLTNRSTITTNSLTYNSDNTFNLTPSSGGTVRIPLSTALNKLEGSIDMWIYPQAYNGGNGLFVNRTGQTANALDWLWLGPYGDTFYFRLGDGVGCCNLDLTVSSWSTRAPLNTWRHVCFTWKSANTSAIYVNGELVTSRSITAIPNTHPDTVGEIGNGHNNVDGSFNGKIPAVKIYDRQLTASEVLQNFNALRGRFGI